MSSRRTLSWKKGWKTLMPLRRGTPAAPEGPQRRPGGFLEDEEAVQCADTTSDIFILCCFHFMCNKCTQDAEGRGSSHPTAGMWDVPIPPDRLWQAWVMRSPSRLDRWTEHGQDSLVLLGSEVSPDFLPAWPGWLHQEPLFICLFWLN